MIFFFLYEGELTQGLTDEILHALAKPERAYQHKYTDQGASKYVKDIISGTISRTEQSSPFLMITFSAMQMSQYAFLTGLLHQFPRFYTQFRKVI